MNINVIVSQESAILAGQNQWGKMNMDIDVAILTALQREDLVRSQFGSGSLRLDNGITTVEAVIEALDALAEKREADKAREIKNEEDRKAREEEKKIKNEEDKEGWVQKYLAMPQSEFTLADDVEPWDAKGIRGEALADPRLAEKWDTRKKELRELKAVYEEREAVELAEREAKELELRTQLAEWVRKNGTPNQQARYDAGLLPGKEILEGIEEETYRPLEGFKRYQKLTNSEVCQCEYENCDVTYTIEDADEATAEDWDKMLAIKEALQAEHPTAAVTLRTHSGEGDECEHTVTRNGIRVEIQVGALEFEREYEV